MNSMKTIKMVNGAALLLSIPFLIVAFGCKDNSVGSGSTLTIDSKLDLSITEQLNDSARYVVLHAQTERLYATPCYSMDYSQVLNGNALSFTFQDVSLQDTACPSVATPAMVNVNLGLLPIGYYTLTVTVNGMSVQGQLQVTDSSYILRNASGQWTNVADSLIFKVPVGAIWGSVAYNDPQVGGSAKDRFFSSLDSLGAVDHVYPAGTYSLFTINSSGTIVLAQGNSLYFDPVVRQYLGSTQNIRAIVEAYAVAYYPYLNINLYTWDGNYFQSSALYGGS